MRPIETAEIAYRPVEGATVAERVIALYWHRRDVAPFRPSGTSTKFRGTAEVNHGRWIVRCPFCTSAQFASKTDRRFFCVECLNEEAGRRWVLVTWPKDLEVEAIEQALLMRPERENRNWLPGGTAADLREENAEHGLPVS